MSRLPIFDKKDHAKGGRTGLDEVLPLVVTTLTRQLLPDEGWRRWATVIKDYDGEPKYRMAEVRMLEMDKNPVESIWSGLTMDARDLNYVKETLTEASLFYAADFLSVNVLKGQKVPRPVQVVAQAGPPIVVQARPAGPPIAPSTALLQAGRGNHHPSSSSSGSSDTRDSNDVTSIEYNTDMSDRERNIETSGEFENQERSNVRTHILNVREEVYSRTPVYEGNVKKDLSKEERQGNLVGKIQEVVDLLDMQLQPGKPHEFQYSELTSVTENFNQKLLSENGRLIGKGGFGEVFLGKTHGKEIAVKRISNLQDKIVTSQFKAEVDSMSWLVHENLLPLLGYCADGSNMCIVYEYMSRGSLEDALACKNNMTSLTIQQRLYIALGTAKGIAHLHSKEDPLVHRDIKSANVLLANDLTPKIGDFGLARLGPQPTSGCNNITHIVTQDIIGTTAYMPPEAYSGEIAPRWDCYSFGVVLQELVTGLPAYDSTRSEKLLPYHIREECENEAEFMALTDNKAGSWTEDYVSRLYKLINNCLNERKSKRWNATQIVTELTSLVS